MSNSSTSSGIGFGGFLTLLFIGLKLTGYINWSWWWVLSPIWISLSVLVIGFIILILFLAGLRKLNNKKFTYRTPKTTSRFQQKLEELRNSKQT